MILSNISVLGFDLDQTLYPKSEEIDLAIQTYLYQKISERLNITEQKAKTLFDDLYKKGAGLSGRKILLHLGFPETEAKNSVQEALEKTDIAKFLAPNKLLLELLQKLKFIYHHLDLITGSNKQITQKKLLSLGFPLDLFDHCFTEEDGSKTDGSAYRLWLNSYPNLHPKHFLYIGDRVCSDYEVPHNLGITSLLVYVQHPDPSLSCPQLPDIFSLQNHLL